MIKDIIIGWVVCSLITFIICTIEVRMTEKDKDSYIDYSETFNAKGDRVALGPFGLLYVIAVVACYAIFDTGE